jgi:hypothetical protein
MKFRFLRSRTLGYLLFVAFSIFPMVASATQYQPGQTLNPSCPPTDPTCVVIPNTTSSSFQATSTTATSTFAGSVSVAGTSSSTNLVVSNNVTIGGLNGILKAVAGVVTSALVNLSSDVTGVLGITNGGTGTSTAPTYGQMLVGNASGGYILVATSSLGFSGAGSSPWAASGSSISYTAGSVGIGTTSASALLTIDSTSTTGTILRISNGSAGAHIFDLLSTGSGNTSGAGRLDIFDLTSNAARLSIAANGNIGIGTTSPASNLSVLGSFYLTGGIGLGAVNTQSGTLNGWKPSWGILYSNGGAPTAAGSNYAVGDTITLNANCSVNPAISVASVSGSGITGYNVQSVGNCVSIPSNPVSQSSTSGSGSGGTFTLSWGPIAAALDEPSLNNGNGNFFIGGTMDSGALNPGELAGGQNFGSENTFVGDRAGGRATSGSFNTAVGHNAFGIGAGVAVTGSNDTALGNDAMRNSTSTSFAIAIGNAAMHNGGVETSSIAIGVNALYGNPNASGSSNIAIGNNTMSSTSITTASNEIYIGPNAGQNDLSGNSNTGIGFGALNILSSGFNNVAIGNNSLQKNNSAGSTAVGLSALQNATGNDETAFGQLAGQNNTGSGNTFIGDKSVVGNGSGGNNVSLGYSAANSLTSGGQNIFIGAQVATTTTTGGNNIIFGYNIALPSINGSNQLDIGNLIFGSGINGQYANVSTGNIGIGTSTPYSRLSVWGTDAASSTLAFNIVNNASTTVFAVFDGGNAQLSGTLTQSSDVRLKTNIQSLDASTSLAAINSLAPVAYDWIDPNKDGVRQYGFIAQQVQQVFPNLVSTTSATALTPDGTLGLNYLGLIAPLVEAVQTLSSRLTLLEATVATFANSFTTHHLKADDLCLSKSDGSQVCVTGDQLGAFLSGTPSVKISAPTPLVIFGTTTPPSINIQGSNPATINVGDTYNDLGAIVHDNQGHDLSYRTFINGALVSNIVIDTSQVATDTVDYVATDTWGNTSTSTRTVIVEAAPSSVQ